MTYQHSVIYKEKKNEDNTYFECSLCGYEWQGKDNIKYCPNCGLIIVLFRNTDGRKPIPVWDAIKAYIEGKKIVCENNNKKFCCTECTFEKADRGINLAHHCIAHGTWYIED